MTNSFHKTAILVFANSAKKELTSKPIPKGKTLFETLTKETLQKVKKTGLPYFHISEKEQKGFSFGERFTNAIAAIFEKGYENIITIGNDTPQLQTAHLLKTKTALAAGKTVLGPSIDGGFYLMGLHKSNFDSEIFKRLPWQRFSLLHRISIILGQSDALLYKLPRLRDVDTLKDVKILSSFINSISKTVLQLLAFLLKLKKRITYSLMEGFPIICLQQPFNKGSPLLLHS